MKQMLLILVIALFQGCSYNSYEQTVINNEQSNFELDKVRLIIHVYNEKDLPIQLGIAHSDAKLEEKLQKSYQAYELPKNFKSLILDINEKKYKIKNEDYPYIYIGIKNQKSEITVAYSYKEPRFID